MDAKEKITVLRKARGWTKRKLAVEAGLNESTVYNWYSERNYEPSKEAIEDVCAAFGISLAEFYSDIEVDKLTDKEMSLLEWFRKVPNNKKDTIIQITKDLSE